MHDKYGKDGLVATSVYVDQGESVANNARVVEFLQKQKGTKLVAVRLDEKFDFWAEKFRNDGILPGVFVFNKQGKYLRFPVEGREDSLYADVEKEVRAFLREKP